MLSLCVHPDTEKLHHISSRVSDSDEEFLNVIHVSSLFIVDKNGFVSTFRMNSGMESRIEIVDRINGLRKQLANLEERAADNELTLQALEQLDTEWEFVNDEIEQLEELLWIQAPNEWPIQDFEEPVVEEEEEEIVPREVYIERELEGEELEGGGYYIPSLHEQQNDYTYEPVFDLADEI